MSNSIARTTGELIELLEGYPRDTPLLTVDADSGGYDCETHYGAKLDIIKPEQQKLGSLSDRHRVYLAFNRKAVIILGGGSLGDHPKVTEDRDAYYQKKRKG